MPNLDKDRFNTRAQFHKDFLRATYVERGLRYTERRPAPATEEDSLGQLIARANDGGGHLATFKHLLQVVDAHADTLS